jgi:hypothetical protein
MTIMTRDEIKAYFDLSGKVADALRHLPWLRADPALGSLQEMADIIGEQLPGSYCGNCPQCEEPKGYDEMVDCGDEKICKTCVARWDDPKKPAA